MNYKYWMISNRNETRRVRLRQRGRDVLGGRMADLSYWVSNGGALHKLESWEKSSEREFHKALREQADEFPLILDPAHHEKQKHVTLFVHGYNVDWADAARRYAQVCKDIFKPSEGLGICVLFTWPSNGLVSGYLPDRKDARRSGDQLAEVLNALYDHLVKKQLETNEERRCRAKTSIIAHSMGNYVLQHAMQHCWTRNNQPLLVSLINQLVMVGADVDNDLFSAGESIDGSDGDAIANLTYRVTSLFTGRDPILGVSAGMKHFGKRRLGRSGLDQTKPIPDNVWDVDCSSLIAANANNIHSAYFEQPKVVTLMRELLRGVDRHVLLQRNLIPEIHATA